MLIAILNTCTKEELEEEEEDEVLSPDVTSPSEEGAFLVFHIIDIPMTWLDKFVIGYPQKSVPMVRPE